MVADLNEGQLDGFSDFLLLLIETTDIAVLDIRLLIGAQHGDARVGLGRENVNQRI
jgi:hypothetical protein